MALTLAEQELFDFGRGALPNWMRAHDEILTATAKMMGMARTQLDYLFGQALITTATGPTATTPDWLNQHARDRGTSRQAGESDVVLQQRLRVIPDALTRQSILDAANAILVAAGVVGVAAMLELPRDGAWIGTYAAMTGTGGTFAQTGTVSTFTPTALPWPTPPFQDPAVIPVRGHRLVIAGAANAGNNGTRTITSLAGNGAVVANAGGVAGADATVTWTVQRLDGLGNVTDGNARSYIGRGWRIASSRPLKIVVILPFGTDAGTQASIEEAIRTKKAAGFAVIVERRLVP